SVNESPLYGPNFAQDPRNRLGDRGRSGIDQRFRYVFSHIWELPWMRNAKGVTGAILGGWAVNGIVQLQSGLPVTIGQTGDSQNTWDFSLFKEFKIREGHNLQFRYEAFKFLNTPQFNAPSRNLGAADFGRISSTVINNREMQFGLKYLF